MSVPRSSKQIPIEEIATDLLYRDAATEFVAGVRGQNERRGLLSREARPSESQAHIPVQLARAIDHTPLAAEGELLLAKSTQLRDQAFVPRNREGTCVEPRRQRTPELHVGFRRPDEPCCHQGQVLIHA